MDPTQFAMWRFRNAEGVMDYVQSWNSTECILNVKGKIIKITYNPATEDVTISENVYSLPINCKFSDFVNTMTKLGYYKERTVNRHSLSYKVPKE